MVISIIIGLMAIPVALYLAYIFWYLVLALVVGTIINLTLTNIYREKNDKVINGIKYVRI